MSFEENKAWADKFLVQQMQILNKNIAVLDFNKIKARGYYINVAPLEDDQNLETDVVMFGTLRIALRVRYGASFNYSDIALRNSRPSGARTEVQKIKEGLGDYYLYCWTYDRINITEYMLIDLDRFRSVIDLCLKEFEHLNDDGTTFNTYHIPSIINKGCCVSYYLHPYMFQQQGGT